MPTLEIEGGNPRNYGWGLTARLTSGWLTLTQNQDVNGYQVILLNPKQARELVAAYLKQYPKQRGR